MSNRDVFLAQMKLRANRSRIESQLPTVATIRCRQIALSLRVRLPILMSTPDWEGRLRKEVKFAIARHGADFFGMDVEQLAQLVMIQCAKDSEDDLKELLQDMNHAHEKSQEVRTYIQDAKEKRKRHEQDLLVMLLDGMDGRKSQKSTGPHKVKG